MTVKAYAINTIKMGAVSHPASTRDQVTIIELEDDDFERLGPDGLGAVRKPTKDELTLWEAAEATKNGKKLTKKQAEAVAEAEGSEEGSTAPDSGAEGDPNRKPKGATTVKSGATKSDDLGV